MNGIIIELRTYEGHLQRLGEPYYEELRLEIHKLFDCKEETQIINDEEYHTIYKDIELEVVARTVIPPITNFTPLTVEKIKEWSCNINETYMFIINNEILDFTEFREDYPNRQKSLGLYGINMSIFISSYRACSGVIIINEPWVEVPGVTEPDYEMIHNSSPDYELYYDKNRVYARMFNDEYTVLEYEGYHYIFDNAEYRGHFMFKIDGEMYTVEEVLNLELLSLLELYESHPFHIMRFRYEHK